MSLFDFPRIHFKGNIDINVPTINNSYYFPLTMYDQTQSVAFLPPRLYFSNQSIPNGVNSTIPVTYDPLNKYWYIEISTINTIELLRTWCMTPLGSVPTSPDAPYFPFYNAAQNDLGNVEGATLMGNCPGYWNMYGDMSVTMNNVVVTGVQTYDGTNVSTWTKQSTDPPGNVASLLNCSVDLDATPGSGVSTATMVETISSQSVYANVFCSKVNLYDASTGKVFLSAKPFRFSALIYSAWRVVNWFPAMSGSARFCSTILNQELSVEDQQMVTDFFGSTNSEGKMLKGLFVTFTLLEVFENRYDQNFYLENGAVKNPAQATTIGSITPWYEGDMMTGIIGRNLISQGSIFNNMGTGSAIPIPLTPAIASMRIKSDGTALFSIDMGNSWPETMTPTFGFGKFEPAKRGDATFETMSLGNLSLRYGSSSTTEFASLAIDPVNNPLSKVAQCGCVFDFPINDVSVVQNIKNNLIQAYVNINSTDTLILQETEYMISTDQKGLYAIQNDIPSYGYYVYDYKTRIPCALRIYQKGMPVLNPISIGVAEYIVPEAANDPLAGPDNVSWQNIADNGVVQLASSSLVLNNNAVYYFVYNGQYPNNNIPVFSPQSGYTVQTTGSFACLRVHPIKSYNALLDPSDPKYQAPDFEMIYNEIFKLYDVVYPRMAQIVPFTKDQWDNGTMAGMVLQRTRPEIWEDITYMPRSRELGPSQRRLLQAWANTYKPIPDAPENK